MKRVAVHTLGCKLNFAETSTLGRQFVERGFRVVDFDQPADVVLLNTCSVTERADREARQWIRRALRTSPKAFVAVVGCYAQLQPEEIASIDGVDVVLGASEKFRLFDYVDDFQKKSYPQIYVSDSRAAVGFGPAYSAEVGNRTRAFLKVQDGCDYSCAFCTIPLARGGSRSQSVGEVIDQARILAQRGYKEIVLTGVNVGDYGKKNDTSFLQLLKSFEGVDGVERVRISSIEPNLLTKEMVDYIIRSPKMCNHFHLPLQSGSDTILKSMRRRYLSRGYREIVEYVLERDPDAGVGADVIVGFPGETEELFEETYRFLVDLPVTYLHVFTYSERPNTPAATFDGVVEPRARFKRSEMLRILCQKKRRAFYSRFIGTIVPVLFEGGRDDCGMSGLTTNYIRVTTEPAPSHINQILPVRITGILDEECSGEVMPVPSSARDQTNFTTQSREPIFA